MLVSDMVNISPAPERTGERIILYAPPCMALDKAHFTKTKELFIFLQRCTECANPGMDICPKDISVTIFMKPHIVLNNINHKCKNFNHVTI